MQLVDATPDAVAWLKEVSTRREAEGHWGKIVPSVLWSDIRGPDGELIVDVDPDSLVAQITEEQFPVLLQHDPGHPLGKILDAHKFISPSGQTFIAGIMGLYAGRRVSFAELSFDLEKEYPPPREVPVLAEPHWIHLAVDPRDVSEDWLRNVVSNSAIQIRATAASYNAHKSSKQLIRTGVLFATIVWNPYVTTIASEAARDTYAAVKTSLVQLAGKLSELGDPILEIQSHHDGCLISFILRGHDTQSHYQAMESLARVGTQAEHLIANLKRQGRPARVLVYEYDTDFGRWYPSYAELTDGTLVTDNEKLIVEQELPTGMSLGLTSIRTKP